MDVTTEQPPTSTQAPGSGAGEIRTFGGRADHLNLSIHGLATMRVDADAPSLDIIRSMFAPFVVDTPVDSPDIAIVRSHALPIAPSHAEHDYRYDEHSVWLADMDVQIRCTGDDRWIVSGTRELLTAVLPLVDEVTTRRGAAMIHATMVDLDGYGILMPAWGGVGKTSTMAKLMKVPGCHFMGDDWGFIDATGRLLGYAKPMFIKPHHRPIYPHLFEGVRKPLVPSRMSKPISKFTTLVHPLVTKYPSVAAFSRRWSPEHRMVTPQEAFPKMDIATVSELAVSVFVERHDGSACNLEPRSSEWMLDRLVGNFYSELPEHSRTVITALTATGILPMHRSQAAKAAVVASGLGDVPCYLLKVPAEWSADRASDEISRQLLDLARSATAERAR